jgi:hypothetical protein
MTDAYGVLKEKDLEQTLSILRAELTEKHQNLTNQTEYRKEETQGIINQLKETIRQSDQNALMLYSQDPDYVFDLTYACHEGTKQYQDFHKQQLPFTEFLDKTEKDIARYDSLIRRLEGMPDIIMTEYGDQKRDTCLVLAKNIRKEL